MKVRTTETFEARDAVDDRGAAADLSRDDTLEILSNRRRRFALHYLKRRRGGPVWIRDLSDRVAGWEYGKPVDDLDRAERKRVDNALRQFHLPKMEEQGFVEVDARGDGVRLTETAARQEFRVDVLSAGGMPWGAYYLGLSAVGAVALAGVWLGVYPLSALPPLSLCSLLAAAFAAGALAHWYEDYHSRLGARERPREAESGPGSDSDRPSE